MKFLCFFCLLLSNSCIVFSQVIENSLLDSVYSRVYGINEHGNEFDYVQTDGFSYNDDCSLSQHRDNHNRRHTFTYLVDTVFRVTEELEENTWIPVSRGYEIYNNGQIIFKTYQRKEESEWINTAQSKFIYSADGGDSITYVDHFVDGEWKLFSKKEEIYNPVDSNLYKSIYYVDETGNFVFNNGEILKFDENNLLVSKIRVLSSARSPRYFLNKEIYTYWYDRISTITRCRYELTDTVSCDIVNRSIFTFYEDYFVEELYGGNQLDQVSARVFSVSSDSIFHVEPDSITRYSYTNSGIDSTEDYHVFNAFEYIDDQKIYHLRNHYVRGFSGSRSYTDTEKWYSLKSITSSEQNPVLIKSPSVILYPNPVISNGSIYIRVNELGDDDLHALSSTKPLLIKIISTDGRHSKNIRIQNGMRINAPEVPGIYKILVFNIYNRVIGVKTIIVI